MYSIVTIIYGVPLTEKVDQQINQWEMDEIFKDKWYEDESGPCGFTTLYHGGSHQNVGYCGVRLDEFDECNTFIDPSNLNITPTENQLVEAQIKIEALPAELRAILEEEGIKQNVYYIFSTS